MRAGNLAALPLEDTAGSNQPSQMELAIAPKDGQPLADTLRAEPYTEMKWLTSQSM